MSILTPKAAAKGRRLSIVADQAMTGLLPLVDGWADVITVAGREISQRHLSEADVLLVRSITQVNQQLLRDGCVSFVGTATIGTDHIDLNLLEHSGVGFAYAPGCNANAVVDYVMSVILSSRSIADLRGQRIGVVGYGNVGRRLAACLNYFGLQCAVYDPLLDLAELDQMEHCHGVSHLQGILDCDIVSLHVPLTRTGNSATEHMLDLVALKKLRKKATLINTSRGAVINNHDLFELLSKRNDLVVALDVWEFEPQPLEDLVERVSYATPHIAGYSSAGKVRGTQMIVSAMLKHYAGSSSGKNCCLPEQVALTPLACVDIQNYPQLEAYAKKLMLIFPLEQEAQSFKSDMMNTPADQIPEVFDRLRKDYQLREEFDYTALINTVVEHCS